MQFHVSVAYSSCLLSSFPLERAMASHSSILGGKSHGWGSLVGCSPLGRYESDTTEQLHFHFSLSRIGKEMATHSSVLAWRMAEPGGLPSMTSHWVRHNWHDLAAAALFHCMVYSIVWLSMQQLIDIWLFFRCALSSYDNKIMLKILHVSLQHYMNQAGIRSVGEISTTLYKQIILL